MIYECLLAPSEKPNALREIKRALLTYDTVKIIDPSDRDIIPSNTFMPTIFGMPIAFNLGSVRPMGKVAEYDQVFERVLDECEPLVKQNLLQVVSTYNISDTKVNVMMGRVPTGGYPLNTKFVFQLYRHMASDQGFLSSAIGQQQNALIKDKKHLHAIAMKGLGDGGINDGPGLPILEGFSCEQEKIESLSLVARARIAALIKYSGYCETKNLIPVFDGQIYGRLICKLLDNLSLALNSVEDDRGWVRRNRVLDICHEEYIDDRLLDGMSIADVLKLRTKAWGRQAESREAFFDEAGRLAIEVSNDVSFEERIRDLISDYKVKANDLLAERRVIGFRLKCDFGIAALSGGVAMPSLLTQISSPMPTIAATLAAGGVWALSKSKDYYPALVDLKKRQQEMESKAGFGIHNFYTRIKKY